jgi:hypothetical protein
MFGWRRAGSGSLRTISAVAVWVVLAGSIVIPALASPTGSRKAPATPPCSGLLLTAVAKLVGTGPLKLLSRTGNFCAFIGSIPGHYKTSLDIQIIPYMKSVWQTAEANAMHSASVNGSTFGHSSAKLFFVSGTKTSAGMSPCTPSQKVTDEFEPQCAGQPDASVFDAIGYGPYKSSSVQLMVSTAATAEQGDVYLSHLLALVTQILSGKIH